VVATLAAAAGLARGTTRARAWRAGLALGAAMAVKYPGVLLAMPVWLGAVMGSAARGWRRLMPGAALGAWLVGAAVFVATSPFLVFNQRTRDFLVMVAHVVLPSVFGEPVASAPDTAPHVAWLAHSALGYHLVFSLRYGAGVVMAVLTPLAVLWGIVDRRPLARLAGVFALFYYLVVGISPVLLARYLTPLMPVVALLAGGLMAWLVARLVPVRRQAAALAAAAVFVGFEPLRASIAHDRLAARTDTRVQATEWLAAHAPPGTRVAIVGTQLWGWGRPQMPPGFSYVEIPPTEAALDGAHAAYLLAHDHVLFSSHVDAVAMAALVPHLELLADFDPTCGSGASAVFEAADAYYLPIAGFAAVCRGGPHVRIYAVRAAPGAGT
jgi:hypothetical protein